MDRIASTRIAGGESAAIATNSPGTIEISNPFDADVTISHFSFVYPDSTYDTSLVSKMEETQSQHVFLSGSVQYKTIGERAGAGQFGRRMVPLERPVRWLRGSRIKVSVETRVAHNARDIGIMFYVDDNGQGGVTGPLRVGA